jgi:hypothetical protein
MVHALEKVHSLLEAGGILIDIHPTGEPPAFEVRIDGHVTRAGWLQETDDFVEYIQADDALANVIRRGLFVVERAGRFTFLSHAPNIFELRNYLLVEYSDAIVDEETVRRVEELYAAPGRDKEVVLRENVHIARLRPV